MSRIPVAILISGSGSNMARLIEDMADPDHPARPVLVISNKAEAGGLGIAQDAGIPTQVISHKGREKAAFEADLHQALSEAGAGIICLAGFMRVLSPDFVETWQGKMLNIHPSLLPLFKGLDTHQRALEAGVAVHGCSVHEVTGDLDSGRIIGQAAVPVRPGDDAATLAARVLKMEHRLYPAALRAFASKAALPISLLA